MTRRDKIMLAVLTAWFVVLCVLTFSHAHETQVLNCGGYEKAQKVAEGVIENGMLAEDYDTDGDGKIDLETLSTVTGTDDKGLIHTAFPVFYWVDRNQDGKVDTVWIDRNGDGFCESIVLYADLSREDRPDTKRKGGL